MYKLHTGRQEDILKDYPENHFHSCVTDPPYGLKFMGKKWDYSVPGVKEWESVLRVMRPGAFLIAFGGTRTYHRLVCNVEDAGFEIRDMMAWIYGSGFPKSHNITDELGTALKPAIEPIVLARKPIDGTVQENYDRWRTGVLNIEACRIHLNGDYKSKPNGRPSQTGLDDRYNPELANIQDDRGRWPANIQHDGSDEVLAVFPMQKSGAMKKPYEYTNTGNSLGAPVGATRQIHEASEGSAARFFYCGKASRADRNEGCESFDKKAMNWSSGTQNPGSFQAEGTDRSSENFWPTVKPTNLMRYYLRLVTPKGGLFLDPYMGSGSTLKAGMHEFLNGVGIDKEIEALPIAEARIQHALRNRDGQMGIF
jgi:DNA modification methylase